MPSTAASTIERSRSSLSSSCYFHPRVRHGCASRAVVDAPSTIAPESPLIGDTVNETSTMRPSFATRLVSNAFDTLAGDDAPGDVLELAVWPIGRGDADEIRHLADGLRRGIAAYAFGARVPGENCAVRDLFVM
jgi:hypothetical protein